MSGNDNSKRSIGQIISDATDEELKDYHKESAGNMTPDRLKAMAARTEKRKRRHMRELAGVAALFILVVVGGIMVFNTFTTDVDADKNAKEELVTEDGVVIEDGGWGSSSEDNWVITDWAEVKSIKESIPQLIILKYVPKGYKFKQLSINEMENAMSMEYLFYNNDNQELIIHQYYHNENLEVTNIYDNDKTLRCSKGTVYIKENQTMNTATIQMNDGCIIEIFSCLVDEEIIKIIDELES